MKLSPFLRYTGLSLVLAVLAVGPFLKGLFFWTELLGAIAAVGAGFGLWLLGRRLGGLSAALPGGWAGGALLALVGLYVLQFAWAVFPRGNLDWVLRMAAGWFAYVMLRAESGPGLRRWLGWTFVVSAVGVGFLGFLEFTGYVLKDPDLASMLTLVGLSQRMFTTFQYPNTAAVYFLAAMLAAAGLALEDMRAWKLGVLGGLTTFLLLAFFFTVSRGAVVALPFGLLLFFAGLDNRRRWAGLLLLVAAAAPMVVAMKSVGLFSAAHNYISAFKWIAAATVGGAFLGVVLAFFLKLSGRVQAALAGVAVVAAVAGLLVLRPAGGLLPAQATRLFDINLKTTNVVLRLIYDQDALSMAADRPLGRGGWGWDRGYRQYQDFNYTARETHDQYAQTAVEAGWLGLAALLTALAGALWAAWQNRSESPLGWTLAAGAGLVAAHSAIDFNLSYGAMWLLLWSLLAVGGRPAADAAPRLERPLLVGGALASVVVLGFALLLLPGSRLTDQAAALAEKGATEQAAATAKRAAVYDRWHSEPLLLMGNLASLERAVKLDPYHSGAQFKLAIARELNKDLPGALTAANAALANQPMVSAHYAKVAALEGTLLNGALHDG
ncbi:MAG TPA: O-antigen ligase family protein, partial [Symbiobacteriaceae bacterium]|nr:O-antigen ligase family protein [Symbiobacteriaceae bacterium]